MVIYPFPVFYNVLSNLETCLDKVEAGLKTGSKPLAEAFLLKVSDINLDENIRSRYAIHLSHAFPPEPSTSSPGVIKI
jgi:hypothetical protein